MKRKLWMGVSALLVMGALTGCGNKSELAGTYDITVWVSEVEGVKELTEQQIDAFEEANPGVVINATVEGVGESDSATQMIQDVESGADIFCFAQDQLARLVQAGALNRLGQATAAKVTEMNDSGAVKAASVNNELYCYPLTSDNGYFMFYDKSVVKEEHLDSLEDILADCEAAGKMFSFEAESSAWYNASWFFATGCVSNWTTDAEGKFVSVEDTFNSEAGLVALKGMQKLLKSPAYNSSSAGADFKAAVPSAVVISGTWATNTVQEILGENFGATDLPSFTVDGKSYHLGSFSGNKLLGVKPQTDAKKAAVLQQLALYLTGEECQAQRFDSFKWGPSNKNVQATDAVKADVALSALAAQSPYAIPQGQIHGSWWDIAKTYATAAKTATTDDELKAALKAYEDAIKGVLDMPENEKTAFTVIGKFGDNNWDKDVKMVEKPAGTWYSESAILFAEGNAFKVRQGKAYDVAFGNSEGKDFTITAEQAGYYFVKLVYDSEAKTGVVTLEKYCPTASWAVIGAVNGTNWNTDFYLHQVGENVYESDELTFAANAEFKLRFGGSWNPQYGMDGIVNNSGNIAVAEAGTYVVRFTLTEVDGVLTGSHELVPVTPAA